MEPLDTLVDKAGKIPSLFDLTGRIAVVTGGAKGLGDASRASDFINGAVIPLDGGAIDADGFPVVPTAE